MNHSCRLSDVTKDYLTEFHCILERMIQGMTSAALTDSISHNFIVQMIPHHQAAIEMSQNILRYTTNIPLQEIAQGIISAQTQSIEDMLRAQCACSLRQNTQQDLCLYQQRTDQILQTMFCGMETARASNRVNCNFMWEMIPHHMGAVEMSRNALRFSICPELKPILDAIITSQQRGIRQMRDLLRCIGCQ